MSRFVSLLGRDKLDDKRWRRYDSYMGSRVFYPGMPAELKAAIRANPKVKEAIRIYAAQQARESAPKAKAVGPRELSRQEKRVSRLVEDMLRGMVARMESRRYLRFAIFLVDNIWARLYDQGVVMPESDITRLLQLARDAERDKISLVFLPCHKSHADYVTLHLLLIRLGISLPAVIAGDNLNFAVIGSFLANVGAFYIRREFHSPDSALYGSVCSAYVEALLERGLNLEWFIEGQRSRSGKLNPPKLGILKMVLDIVASNDKIKDVYLVPVSVGYDNVLESKTYVEELSGREKRAESFGSLVKRASSLDLELGSISVRFAKHISVRDFVARESETHKSVLPLLAYRIMADINDAAVILPSALVGTVILTSRGRGIDRSTLAERIRVLALDIKRRGYLIAETAYEDPIKLLDKVLPTMSQSVSRRGDLLDLVIVPEDRFRLSLNRNQLAHIYLTEALACVAIYGSSIAQVPLDFIYSQARFLSKILQHEFIYPNERLDENLQIALDTMEADNVLMRTDEGISLSSFEIAQGWTRFYFYSSLIWPFLDAYYLAGISLLMLAHEPGQREANTFVPVTRYIKVSQKLGTSLFYAGNINYIESINMESALNAVQWFIQNGLLELERGSSRRKNAIRLSDELFVKNEVVIKLILGINLSRRRSSALTQKGTIGQDVLRYVQRAAVNLHTPSRL